MHPDGHTFGLTDIAGRMQLAAIWHRLEDPAPRSVLSEQERMPSGFSLERAKPLAMTNSEEMVDKLTSAIRALNASPDQLIEMLAKLALKS